MPATCTDIASLWMDLIYIHLKHAKYIIEKFVWVDSINCRCHPSVAWMHMMLPSHWRGKGPGTSTFDRLQGGRACLTSTSKGKPLNMPIFSLIGLIVVPIARLRTLLRILAQLSLGRNTRTWPSIPSLYILGEYYGHLRSYLYLLRY